MFECFFLINITLQEENQKLRDEINNLKGEQGKPGIFHFPVNNVVKPFPKVL
jgi:hypothetical protein